jgi:hypothetical protein
MAVPPEAATMTIGSLTMTFGSLGQRMDAPFWAAVRSLDAPLCD